MEMMISDFNLIIKQLGYPVSQKKFLLLLYIKRYLLFELKPYKMQGNRLKKNHDVMPIISASHVQVSMGKVCNRQVGGLAGVNILWMPK